MSGRTKQPWASVTDIGRLRTHNEDSVLAQPPLFVVADGLGGHEAGEVASSIAVETLRDHAPRRADANALARAVRAANREVIRAAKEGVGRSGMGTTLTAAIVEGGTIAIAHVGDSRAYLLHEGSLRRLSDDHSMVADMIRRGQLTEADARVHPNRSVITRALGTDSNMVADTYEIEASTGDRLLLCSDGLTGMLEDPRIAELLGGYSDPGIAASELVAAANEAGGHDNISVIVVDIEADAKAATGVRETDRSLRGWISVAVWILAAIAIVAAAGYGAYRYAITRAYVVSENGTVAVYQGVPGELAGIQLRWLVDTVQIDEAELSLNERARLEEGVRFDSTREALDFAESLQATSSPLVE
jgi:protein phosphatase